MAAIAQHDTHLGLEETTIDGARTRRWELDASQCPELAAHRVARLGVHEVAPPYRRVRIHPGGSFLMASVAGRGRVLLDGAWQTIGAGVVCLAPPRVLNAFHAVSGQRWEFCWVRYDEPPHVRPIVSAASPLRVRGRDGEALGRVIAGLRAEWESARAAKAIHHWLELLDVLARRVAHAWQGDDRLWRFWETVNARLAHPWDLEELARAFHSSKEHLRRLCLRELGRSPMQHLASLRIQRAQGLLESTDDKIETIAATVGYESALVFSRSFKRWIGTSPGAYRQRA